MTKLLNGLIKRMDGLFEESEEIFFAEHPFLENRDWKPEDGKTWILEDSRREMNTLEKQKIFEAIDKELGGILQTEAQEPRQEGLL